MINRFILFFFGALLSGGVVQAQRVWYAEPENDDSRQTSFEIIGKYGNQYLVYKNTRFNHAISIYDEQMKLKDKVVLDFFPANQKVINSDFITYPDYALLVYQYQKRGVVYCMGAKIGPNGQALGTPVELDTAELRSANDNKVYSVVYSEDRKQIMVFKINSRNRESYVLTTLLFDKNLNLMRRTRSQVPMPDREMTLNDFQVANSGDFYFTRTRQNNGRDYTDLVELMLKPVNDDTLRNFKLDISNRTLDEIQIKVDNLNKKVIMTSFFYRKRGGNIEGMHAQVWDMTTAQSTAKNDFVFSDEFKQQARSDGSVKNAFNDFFIRKIIVKKDGGFLVTTEHFVTYTRGNPFSRNEWLWGSPGWYNNSMFDYYPWVGYRTPWTPYYFGDRSRFGQLTRYESNNIAVFSFAADASVQWTNVLVKSQYDDVSPDFISHQLLTTAGEIHFLFNSNEKRSQLMLNDLGILPNGQINRHPTWRGISREYDMMLQFGKQVSAMQMIVPCSYANTITFAKLEL